MPHCLEAVPDIEWRSHQDWHLAERLAAEESEQDRNEQYDNDEALAKALATEDQTFHSQEDEGEDYHAALALNRALRAEDEEMSFRNLLVSAPLESSQFGSRKRNLGLIFKRKTNVEAKP